jgi:predicted amidohydrolase
MTAGDNVAANIAAVTTSIRTAAARGARLIATPEMTGLMTAHPDLLRAHVVDEAHDLMLQALCSLAAELQIFILIGSLAVRLRADKIANRSFVINDAGHIIARYDKIHMFDVDLPGGERHRESNIFVGGDKAVMVGLPFGKLGLSICYDLRFPYLYRALAHAGADIISVPAAFTQITGRAHWHALLRARAIENTCFIMAPAQCGTHPSGRITFGHSLVISPWGEVLADGGDAPGVITVAIDIKDVAKARSHMPSLKHERKINKVEIL